MSSKKFITKNLAIVGLITFFVLTSAGVAFAQESKIIVSPNRFVVLDDPNTGTKASGFFDPTDVRGGSWNSNYWSGESTTIRAAAQVLNSNGQPQSGITVAFTLKNPGNTVKNTVQSTTDNKGIAYYSFNLNEQKYWGYWTIEANATVSGVNVINKTSFALNWWGCTQCHGSENPGNWGSMYTPKSYYMMGYDFHKSQNKQKHTEAMSKGNCIICHQMYNGTPVDWGFTGNSPTLYNDNEYSPDWHKGKAKCQNCHEGSNRSTTPQGKNPEVAGCYDTAGCHAKKNNNLTNMLSTTGYVVGGSYRTNYSFIPNNAVKAHNGSSIPCITCHNAGHNITKPYNTTSTSNSYTEYQQCTTCHQSYTRHNSSVSCTVCHSQDAHAIKVFSQSAGYVSGRTNSLRGNCTNCHQNSTFQNNLEAQPKAGDYTGRDPPQISVPLNHSTDQLSGALWNGAQSAYWINTSQLSACDYCHDNSVLHNATALGNVSSVKGTNNLNQSLTGSTWCANCHYGNAPGYAGNQLAPQPPEVLNKSGLVPANAKDGTPFYNHSDALSTSYDDVTCKACHNNNLAAGATSLTFSHNLATGSAGGKDCVGCHDKGKSVEKVDVSKMNQTDSIHNFLNNNSVIITTGLNPDNKRCWACHTDSSPSADNVVNEDELPASGHPNGYNVPAKCTQCHIQGNFSALVVSEHFSGSTEISTKFYANTNNSCVNCHNKSEMLLSNSDPNGPKSIYASVSHYGSNKTNVALYVSGGSANCTYCHQDPANAFTTEMIDAAGNSSISNHTQLGTNPACINCHNSGRIHFATLTKPAVSSSLCINCHTNRDQHNGSVECSQCHTQSNRSIHPIQYLQPDGTFKINSPANKSTAVNCTNCHQGAGVSGFDGAPKVPEPMNHSTALSAGQKWGNYWDNTSQITACYYCHQIEIHENNTGLLGNVSVVEGSNTLNNPDLANSTWCANCHYAAAPEYKGNLLAIPPPEITNSSLVASDGTLFFNHSSLTGFNDSNCKGCHGFALSGYSQTSLNLSHSVSEGGGDSCIDCHGTNYIGATPSVTSTFVNISAFNESIHQDINATPPTTLNNIDCWTCHFNKDMNRQNVKKCGDCHRKPSQWHGNAAITTNLSELW